MSHTNSTTNYNLPKFVGTDKPAWLTDFNGAMDSIDAQMKENDDAAAEAGTKADTAQEDIGNLSALTTTEKNTLVGAINEIVGEQAIINMTSVDPGEGAPLAANHFIAVYEA